VTAVSDRREELEAVCWRNSLPAPLVAEILTAADAYAKSCRDPKPPAPRKPPAVHWMRTGRPNPACRPFDPPSANRWPVATDLEAVTCGHCRKIFGRAEVVGAP
jgi:hypothetical protein